MINFLKSKFEFITTKLYKQWHGSYGAKFNSLCKDMQKLHDFCLIMDNAIGERKSVIIYANRKFMLDYILAMGSIGAIKLYDGHDIVIRNQKEYFYIEDISNKTARRVS